MPAKRLPKWSEVLVDDRKWALEEIQQARHKPLIEQLLQIQAHMSMNPRSFRWAHSVTCLRLVDNSKWNSKWNSEVGSTILQEVSLDNFSPASRYVAVSYCNERGLSEPTIDREYSILRKGCTEPQISEARAYVYHRVVNFSRRHSIDKFWVDDDCLGHTDRIEALNGMDIVYRKATKCVGLLSVRLHTEDDVGLLDMFLSGGHRILCDNSKQAIPNPLIGEEQLRKICRLLERIFLDD